MWTQILNTLLGNSADEPAPAADAELALAALLVRVARADGVYDTHERGLILRLVQRRGGLSHDEAEDRLHAAEALEEQSADTVRFTRDIKAATSPEDRQAVMQDLWSIVLADGARDPGEDQLMRLSASLLGVSDVDSALARQRAAQDAGLI